MHIAAVAAGVSGATNAKVLASENYKITIKTNCKRRANMKLTKSEALTVLELIRNAAYLPAHIYHGEFKNNLDTIHDKLVQDIKQRKIL